MIINQFAIISANTMVCYDYENLVKQLTIDIYIERKLNDKVIHNIRDLSSKVIRVSNVQVDRKQNIHYEISNKSLYVDKLNKDVFCLLKSLPIKPHEEKKWRVYSLPIPKAK